MLHESLIWGSGVFLSFCDQVIYLMGWQKTPKAGRDGAWFQLNTCLLMSVLLVLNVAFIGSLYRTLAPDGSEFLRHPKVEQMFLLIGPLLVLLFQWWLIDVLKNQLGAARKRDRR